MELRLGDAEYPGDLPDQMLLVDRDLVVPPALLWVTSLFRTEEGDGLVDVELPEPGQPGPTPPRADAGAGLGIEQYPEQAAQALAWMMPCDVDKKQEAERTQMIETRERDVVEKVTAIRFERAARAVACAIARIICCAAVQIGLGLADRVGQIFDARSVRDGKAVQCAG